MKFCADICFRRSWSPTLIGVYDNQAPVNRPAFYRILTTTSVVITSRRQLLGRKSMALTGWYVRKQSNYPYHSTSVIIDYWLFPKAADLVQPQTLRPHVQALRSPNGEQSELEGTTPVCTAGRIAAWSLRYSDVPIGSESGVGPGNRFWQTLWCLQEPIANTVFIRTCDILS